MAHRPLQPGQSVVRDKADKARIPQRAFHFLLTGAMPPHTDTHTAAPATDVAVDIRGPSMLMHS
jgi:hypothetical protein